MIIDSSDSVSPGWDDSPGDRPSAAGSGSGPRQGFFQQTFEDQLLGLLCVRPGWRPDCFPNRFKAEALQTLAWSVSAALFATLRRHFRSAESRAAFLQTEGLDPAGPARQQLRRILGGDRRAAIARIELLEKLLAVAGYAENPVYLRWLLWMSLGEIKPTSVRGIRTFFIDHEDLHLIVEVYAYGLGDFYADIVYPFQAYDLYSSHVPYFALSYRRFFDTHEDVGRVEFTEHGREKLMWMVINQVRLWRLAPAPEEEGPPGGTRAEGEEDPAGS